MRILFYFTNSQIKIIYFDISNEGLIGNLVTYNDFFDQTKVAGQKIIFHIRHYKTSMG